MTAPDIRNVQRALQDAGLSRRQAKALLFNGWRALVGESAAEAEELRLKLADLQQRLSVPDNQAVSD